MREAVTTSNPFKVEDPGRFPHRGPALSGDVTIQTAEVVDKMVDEQGRHPVQAKHLMRNQKDVVMCTGTPEIQLPKRI